MTRLLMLIVLLAIGLPVSFPAFAADEEKDKTKEKGEKEKDEKKDEEQWTTLLTVVDFPGGFKHFDVTKGGKVKFSWDTKPDGRVPNFRVTVAKLNPRNGNFQIFGTIATTHGASKKSAVMNLVDGKYRLYIATKDMKYTLTVAGKEK